MLPPLFRRDSALTNKTLAGQMTDRTYANFNHLFRLLEDRKPVPPDLLEKCREWFDELPGDSPANGEFDQEFAVRLRELFLCRGQEGSGLAAEECFDVFHEIDNRLAQRQEGA